MTDAAILLLGDGGRSFTGCAASGRLATPVGDISPAVPMGDGREVWAFERGEGGFGFLFASARTRGRSGSTD